MTPTATELKPTDLKFDRREHEAQWHEELAGVMAAMGEPRRAAYHAAKAREYLGRTPK